MTFPNLVIAGAPKCGTSSLFNWLVEHPDVCGSSVKETFFLMGEDDPLRRKGSNVHDHGLAAYARFFPDCTENDRIIVEATTHYMYQATALDVLASLPTKPRIVFLLRKPSERVLSSFDYSKNNLGNVRADVSFAEFIRLVRGHCDAAQLERAFGASAHVLASDVQYSRYIDYLSPWRERLGEDRLCILLFESMRADPKAFMQRLCSWLGIDDSYYDTYDFSARNRTAAVRSPRAQRLARALAANVPAGFVKNVGKRLFVAVQAKGRSEARNPADAAALAELDEEFRAFNERLAREFGLNLSAWE